MASLIMPPGLHLNRPLLSATPYWRAGVNIRFWEGQPETIGLFGPLRNSAGTQMTLPGTARYRSLFTTPSSQTGQILAGSASDLVLMQFDPTTSTPGAPARWELIDVAPYLLPPVADTLTDPAAGRVEIPPTWWFADQDDLVVGSRAAVNTEPVYAWDRNSANSFIPLANSPLGAVGGGIVNRILVLLGCTSYGGEGPNLTVRWSDRFDFEEWTPSDISLAGELQLEGGSRIVGGGYTGFGIIAWTDKRMALFTETGLIDSVFGRRYVDGARGLLANRAWCEADGVVWWLDENRVLNGYDGGRPRQIVNPLRYMTVERVADHAVARIHIQPNPEFGEILIWYPTGQAGDDPDACAVFNYLENAWSYWRMVRTGWSPRFGIIPTLGINAANQVFRHDIDLSYSSPYDRLDPLNESRWTLGSSPNTPANADVTAFDWLLCSNLIATDRPTSQRLGATRLLADHIPMPATGAGGDTMSVSLLAYADGSLSSLPAPKVDTRTLPQGAAGLDFRVEGKAIQLRLEGVAHKTVWRLGEIGLAPKGGGER